MMSLFARGIRSRRATHFLPALIAVGLAACLSAQAQEKTKSKDNAATVDTLQEVVVTGSRIARSDLERLEPTTVISAATIDERGFTDVGQALSSMPAFGIPTNGSNVQSTNGIAQSFVDLF